MDRTRALILSGLSIVCLALAGNALRATTPPAAGELGLGGVTASDAGPFMEEGLDAEFLDVLRAREVLYRTYTGSDGEPVWLFLGYFDRQKEGSQVHSPRHCYPGSGWTIQSEPRWSSPWGGEDVASLVVFDGSERRLVLYWYQMRAGTESDVLPLKLEMTRRALTRQPQDVVFASISTPTGPDSTAAMRRLAPLARSIHTEVDRLYQQRDASLVRN